MSASSPRLRIGLIGAGMVSTHHLGAWARVPEAHVVAVADPDLERARGQADSFGISTVFPSADEMMRGTKLDAVDIAAPVAAHAKLCRLAAGHSLAILCQKPLAATASEAAGLVDEIAGRVRLMVHENWRFRPTYRQAKEWLDAGEIGNPVSVHFNVRSSGLIAKEKGEFPALIRQPFLAELPRLLVFEVLIHHLDVLRWLFGELSVSRVRLSRECPAVVGEDKAEIGLRSVSGVSIALNGSLIEPGAPTRIDDDLRIIGMAGEILIGADTAALRAGRSDKRSWDYDWLYAASYEGALRAFVAGLRGAAPFETEASDNLEVLRLVEAIYQHAKAGL